MLAALSRKASKMQVYMSSPVWHKRSLYKLCLLLPLLPPSFRTLSLSLSRSVFLSLFLSPSLQQNFSIDKFSNYTAQLVVNAEIQFGPSQIQAFSDRIGTELCAWGLASWPKTGEL